VSSLPINKRNKIKIMNNLNKYNKHELIAKIKKLDSNSKDTNKIGLVELILQLKS